MIVKNEENVIARCLESVQGIADEIIIVDTGSTDRTKEIVRTFTDKLYDFAWINDFAAARNYSFRLANMEYILWLDADDVIFKQDREQLLELKQTLDPTVDSVSMHYHLSFDGQGNVTSSLRRNRLVKRSKQFQWVGAVHEYLAVHGHIVNSQIAITHSPLEHDAHRNITIYEGRLAAGEDFTPRDLYYYANELRDHKQYEKAIEYYQKFLDTKQGWVEDCIAACEKLADCCFGLGDQKNQLKYIFQSFTYGIPRPEFCCRLGYHFMQQNQFQESIFWYKLATQLEKPQAGWGNVNHACWTWLPHIQLCVCYDKLGQHELAFRHNEMAAAFIPDDPRIIYNRQYFDKILRNSRQQVNEKSAVNPDTNLTKLHLGCGKTPLPGWINLDCVALPGVDIVADLDQCATHPLPFPDNTFDELLARHLLEHIRQPLPMMQELYRIACPNARATFVLPYGSSDDAFEDPTHVRQYFLQSFGYFSQPYYWRADYGYRGDWLTRKIILRVPASNYAGKSRDTILRDVMTLRNIVQEMTVEMIAVKPARQPQKNLQVPPLIEFEFA
jgi:glycosyltransferase involved in cell wall biosynthesis/SAM-dependent methyltransferase